MSLSSKTLFHFTREKKHLLNILKNGLYIRYSLETYGKILKNNSELVLPISCYCDIPLSQISEHTKKYGNYSIGLTKNWGIKNGLSPVLYTHRKSETAKLLNSLTQNLSNVFNIDDNEENRELLKQYDLTEDEMNLVEDSNNFLNKKIKKRNMELSEQLGHFLKYIKPYEGTGYSGGREFKKVRFYDEREWRYVPPKKLLERIEVKDIYKRKFYIDPIKRRYINIKLAKHIKLTFKPKDIRFIVVHKENEIPDMIDELKNIFGNSATHNELMILNSRIISLEQVIDDL